MLVMLILRSPLKRRLQVVKLRIPTNGITTKQLSLITVTTAGTYTVTITDAKGCTATASIAIRSINVECGNRDDKVVICHNNHSECVSASAVSAHLKHGDKLGYCDDEDAIQDITVYPNPVIGGNVCIKNSRLPEGQTDHGNHYRSVG